LKNAHLEVHSHSAIAITRPFGVQFTDLKAQNIPLWETADDFLAESQQKHRYGWV
jgi:hypothetical protein